MALNFFTIVVKDSEEIHDLKRVAEDYLSTWFAIDLVSSLPLTLFDMGSFTRIFKIFKFSKLLKALRLLRLNKLVDAHADEIEIYFITSEVTTWLNLLKTFLIMM